MYKVFTVIAISMMPFLELRASIPIGVASGLNIWETIIISIIGNILPVPFILLFINKIFKILQLIKPFESTITKLRKKADNKKDIINEYGYWGLFLLVAIPIPGTGAWTGSLVAALFNLDIKKSILFIFLGIIAAAIIVSILTYGVSIFI